MALTNKLAAIGDAIRNKTGGTDLLTLDEMVTEIEGISGGGVDFSDYFLDESGRLNTIIIQGTTKSPAAPKEALNIIFLEEWLDKKEEVHIYGITGYEANPFINVYTPNILSKFHLHIKDDIYYSRIPTFTNACYTTDCINIYGRMKAHFTTQLGIAASYYATTTEIEKMYQNITFISNSWVLYSTGESTPYNIYYTYVNQYNMTSIPSFDSYLWGSITATASYIGYYYRFSNCYMLKDITLPVYPNVLTTNAFTNTFANTYNLRHLVFEECEAAQWKNQTIDLTTGAGSGSNRYPSGYTNFYDSSKIIDSAETYEALKDDEFAWSNFYLYDLYNHDSAVETINSLPDTSAYLAANGGTNTIKFSGFRGRLTTGGAINTLTADEIAVAAAKGWTVTIS